VAAALGNTPAVCRKAYVDPVVFEAWRSGALAAAAAAVGSARQWERAALKFLARAHRSS
jgi:DNA topoisomerase IB